MFARKKGRDAKEVKIKCDTCKYKTESDERSVGLGFIPICSKGHWGGESDYEPEEYCTYRDKCPDYKCRFTTSILAD